MITKNYGKYIVVCDCCGEQVGDPQETWEDAVEARREDPDIKTRKINGEWRDTCRECEGRLQ